MTPPENSQRPSSPAPVVARPLGSNADDVVPRWQYERFQRWFNEDTQTSRQIAAEAARQAGER